MGKRCVTVGAQFRLPCARPSLSILGLCQMAVPSLSRASAKEVGMLKENFIDYEELLLLLKIQFTYDTILLVHPSGI